MSPELPALPARLFLMVGAILFCIGFIGVLTRRNVLVIFMSARLMMNAVNLSLIAFETQLNSLAGAGTSSRVRGHGRRRRSDRRLLFIYINWPVRSP